MKEATLRLYPEVDIVIKAAAVSDYRPAEYRSEKMKKGDKASTVDLIETDDILGLMGKAKKQQFLVGFAAETENLISRSREKLERKNLDMIVANDVSAGIFGEDTATVHILTRAGSSETLTHLSKASIANRILDVVQASRSVRGHLAPSETNN